MSEKISKPTPSSGSSSQEIWGYLKFVSSLGFGVCGIVVLFFLAGWLLDRYFLTGATGIAVCMFAGGVLSVVWAWKRVSLMMEKLYRQMREENTDQSLSADDPLNDNK